MIISVTDADIFISAAVMDPRRLAELYGEISSASTGSPYGLKRMREDRNKVKDDLRVPKVWIKIFPFGYADA
jgi:hypothetical protein